MKDEADPFELLGVAEDADEPTIKSAFRKLAKTCHPDATQRPEDRTRFEALDRAYKVLLDPVSRARALSKRRSSRPGRLADAFDQVFQDMAAASQRKDHFRTMVPPVRAEIEISLEQAFKGGPVVIEGAGSLCAGCKGLGQVDAPKGVPCGSCRGRGIFQRSYGLTTTRISCQDCSASGIVHWVMCGHCGGYGASGRKLGRIILPRGIESGSTIRDVGRIGGADLEVKVVVRPHSVFIRRQNDLVASFRLPIWDAALGCMRQLATIEGTPFQVGFVPGTQPRSMQSFAGMGMMDADGKRGALIIVADVVVPDASSGYPNRAFTEMRKAMKEVSKAG